MKYLEILLCFMQIILSNLVGFKKHNLCAHYFIANDEKLIKKITCLINFKVISTIDFIPHFSNVRMKNY